jgi:O-antigen ligase
LDVAGLAFAGRQKQAHSAWVKILTENGIPGIAMLLLFIGSFFAVAIRVRVPGVRGMGLLTATALTVGFLSTEFQSKDLWLLAMSVAAILSVGMPRRELSDAALICREEQEVQVDNI